MSSLNCPETYDGRHSWIHLTSRPWRRWFRRTPLAACCACDARTNGHPVDQLPLWLEVTPAPVDLPDFNDLTETERWLDGRDS